LLGKFNLEGIPPA
jgi:heat shock protein 1/8